MRKQAKQHANYYKEVLINDNRTYETQEVCTLM